MLKQCISRYNNQIIHFNKCNEECTIDKREKNGDEQEQIKSEGEEIEKEEGQERKEDGQPLAKRKSKLPARLANSHHMNSFSDSML